VKSISAVHCGVILGLACLGLHVAGPAATAQERDGCWFVCAPELNIGLIEPGQTGGWVESHFDIVDKFSPSERPGDEGAYTHELNLEWDTALRPFHRLPDDRYLAHLEVEGSLDFVATGLPRAGDLVGDERFVTDASPWSFSLLFVFPLAPLPR